MIIMSLSVDTEPVPLTIGDDGVARVGQTRVTLETIIAAFAEGETPEEIVLQYPSLGLADVYAVIGYYLHNRERVDEYLDDQRQRGAAVRAQNEARSDPSGIRERLEARRARPRS
jgi:uncharacterized protein (DUF433 family)